MSIFEPETNMSSLEIVTCSLCLIPNNCGPILPSNWRAMRIDGQSHFICAAHFPDCDCNDPSAWRAAYAQAVKEVRAKNQGESK